MMYRIIALIALISGAAAFAAERSGATYREGSGILLGDDSKSALGLALEDVAERTLAAETRITAQVYSAAGDDGSARASLFVESATAAMLRPGQAVAAASPVTATGTIRRIDRTTEELTGHVEILIGLPDPEHRLRVGDFVHAVLTGQERPGVTAVPRSALLNTAYGDYVFVVNGDALLRTQVRTGATEGDYIEIVDGLFSGDVVAVRAVESLYQIELRATKGGGHCH